MWNEQSVLLVGCGSIGQRHARVLRNLGVADLRICDPAAEQRNRLADQMAITRQYDTLDAGLAEGPDCVFVLTPPRMHIAMAIAAMRAGAHVFCEKPLTDRLDGLDTLRQTIQDTSRVCMVGLCFRFHEGLQLARQWLKQGRIGRLVSIRALMGEHIPDMRPDYRRVWTPEGIRWGALDLTHDIDLVIWYADQPVNRVCAIHGSFSDIGLKTPDVAEMLIAFKDRCMASVHLDFFQRPRRRQIELMGVEGVIIVEFGRWDSCRASIWTGDTEAWEHHDLATDRDDMFKSEDRMFLEATVAGELKCCGIDDALPSIEVVMKALEDDGEDRA